MHEPPVDIVDRYRTTSISEDRDFREDREYCDACAGTGAQVEAFVLAELPSGLSVAYCAHHATRYLTRLREVALVIIDHRHLVG